MARIWSWNTREYVNDLLLTYVPRCAIYNIRTYCIGVEEMGVNLRRKIIFKSRQMVSYSNSFIPCQNYHLTPPPMQCNNRTAAAAAVPTYIIYFYRLAFWWLAYITYIILSQVALPWRYVLKPHLLLIEKI